VRDMPPRELLSSGPHAGADTARSGRNTGVSNVERILTVGGGGRQLGSEATMAACLRTIEDAGTGQPVASCTMRAKLARVAMR
jgi:hypothetical protein